MKKSVKTLSAAALAFTVLTGCGGSEAKSINFEENYTTAQTAALSVMTATESTEGFFISMDMVMDIQAKYEGMDMDMTMEMTLYINHVGDNYYMETTTSMLGEEQVIGAAIEKQSDGSYYAYSWAPDFYGDIAYNKTAVPASEVEDTMESLMDMDTDMGIQNVFLGDFANIETAMKTAIMELVEEDSFSDMPIQLGNLEDIVIKTKATEKGNKKTFKVTADLPSATEGESLSITFGIVVDGEILDSLLLEMSGKGNVEGVSMSYDVEVTQKVEAAGRTDSKYTSIPQNVTWVEA